MFAALLELLGTEAFMPHGHCYLWTPGLLWLMVGSDLLIAFAYFTRLDLLYSRTERLDRMLRGLLDYYRAGLDRAEPTVVDLEALFDRVVTLVEPPERFTVEVDLRVPTARLPEPPIVQVLVNLLSNAIRHHDRDEGNIRVTVDRDPDGVVLEVRDDGPGIADQHRERVFEALRTLRPRDEVDTPGIGLALVKRVVERHGGRVSLTSTSGEGSTFTVYWPEGTYMGVTPSLLDPAAG